MKIRTTPIEKTVTTKDIRKIMPTLFQLQRDSERRGVEIGTPITVKKRLLGKGNKLIVRSGVLFKKPDVGYEDLVQIEPGEIEVGSFHTHLADYSGELFYGTYGDVPVMSAGDFCSNLDENPDKIECVSGWVDCKKHTKKCPVINCFRLRKTKNNKLPKLTRDIAKKVCHKDIETNETLYYKHDKKIWRKILSEKKETFL